MSVIYSNRPNGDFVLTPFSNLIKTSKRAYIASPYFTEANLIHEAAENGTIMKLLIGLNEATSPSALQKIFNVQNVSIRYYTKRFHAKIFIFDQSALLGSANLTDGGLRSNREAVIELDSYSDTDSFDNLCILFAELWEKADVLTPEKLEVFKNSHKQMHKNMQIIEDTIKNELGITQPPNTNSESRKTSRTRTFLEKLRQEVHEQYIPAFTEIKKIIEEHDELPHGLENLKSEFVANRFLNYLRETHARGEKIYSLNVPQPIEVPRKLIAKYYEEWTKAKDGKIPEDYKERLDKVWHTFGSTIEIMAADEDQIMNGLLSLHAFSNRYKYVAGGASKLAEEFWKKNELLQVKSSLNELLHGKEEFVISFHDYLYDRTKKLKDFGYFCALELFGTVNPDICPPINGRMAKSLRFLGFDVKTV